MNIYIDIYGIKLSVFSNNASLFEMIKKYYEPFLVDRLDSFDVSIDLERFGYFSQKKPFVLGNEYVTFGSGVKIDTSNTRYFFSEQEVSGILDFSDKNVINIQGRLIPNSLRHIVHILLQGVTRIDKYYNRFLIKTCIHDIVFILLEKKLKSCLLHCTAVTNGEKTYLFTGLGGSGKSTMASSFSQIKGYTILSDNYGIVSKNTIYPFPELPRVTKGTQKLLGIDLNAKADGTKNYLDNDVTSIKKSYKIDKIFICSYGKDASIQQLSDKKNIFELLYSINNYTKEFPEYLNLAMLSIIGKFNTNNQRIKNLNTIIDSNDFYMLRSSKDLTELINKIINV